MNQYIAQISQNSKTQREIIVTTLKAAGYHLFDTCLSYKSIDNLINIDSINFLIMNNKQVSWNNLSGVKGYGKQFTFQELDKFVEYISAPPRPTTATIKLNNEYSAKVNKNGKVTVGCQNFSISAVADIIKAYEELIKE